MTTSRTTRPVNITMCPECVDGCAAWPLPCPRALRQRAEAWIASNGLPHIALVEQAIHHSELAGDPFCDNPFRRVLLEVAYERGANRFGNPEGM